MAVNLTPKYNEKCVRGSVKRDSLLGLVVIVLRTKHEKEIFANAYIQ